MRADLTVDSYATFTDLLSYMHGSAAVIGLQMLPLLRPARPRAGRRPARALGIAFQLTNFIRDVGEDLARGRLYLPAEDLAAHGVTRADLERGDHTPAVRDLMAFQVARARSWYAAAAPGVRLLHPDSRACIDAATRLYRGSSTRSSATTYRVLDRRAASAAGTRLRVGVAATPGPDAPGRATRSGRRTGPPAEVHSASAKPNSRSSTGA